MVVPAAVLELVAVAVHLQVEDRALPELVIRHVVRVQVALELVAVRVVARADQPLPVLGVPFLVGLGERVERGLLVVEDALVLVDLLELVLHAVERVEDVELGLFGLEGTAAVGEAVGLLVQRAEVVQVFLDLFAVPGVLDCLVGRELAAVDHVFV